MRNSYDPDLVRKMYTIGQIASSYQMSHVSDWNIPSDEEFAYSLRLNGHTKPEHLEQVKAEYRRLCKLYTLSPYPFALWSNKTTKA